MKKTLRILLLTLLALPFAQSVRAQVDPQFTQYFAIPAYYNSAATGTTDFIRIRGGSRLQWVGIENAPKSFLLTADMPFKLFNKRFGTGVTVQQESLGLYRNLTADAQLSYKIKLFGGVFSAGIQIGFMNENFKGSKVILPDDDDYHQGDDEDIPRQDLTGSSIDLGAGIFYEHKLFWAGVSLQHANSPVISFDAESGQDTNEKNYEFQAGRTLYFIAGSNIPIKNTLFELIPSVLVKSDFTFTTAEATARLRYRKFLSAGLGYRYDDAVSVILAAEFKNFYLGYSFDYPMSAISKASSGSHEIFAGYSLKLDLSEKNRHRHKSIRIM